MTETTNVSRVLVLSAAEEHYQADLNDQFVTGINKLVGSDLVLEWHNYHDLRFEFETGGLKVYIQSTGKPLDSFSFVYFKSYLRYSEQAAVVAAYLKSIELPFACSELNEYLPMTKLTQFSRLALGNIPIVPTIYLDSANYVTEYDMLVARLGSPFIFKSTYGRGGDQNYLIRSVSELAQALQDNPGLPFVAQKFIENESDLRILIVNSQIGLIIERRRTGDSHLNNTSQGATAELKPVSTMSEEHQNLSLKAAALLKREIAGVDLMFETGTNRPYVLEVNASPQVASGAFVAEKLAVYSNYFENVVK